MLQSMSVIILGIFFRPALEADMNRASPAGPGTYALAHNVAGKDHVELVMQSLLGGGSLLRASDAPEHGGYRGYVADPDGHAWEVAWNPVCPIDAAGHVTFGV